MFWSTSGKLPPRDVAVALNECILVTRTQMDWKLHTLHVLLLFTIHHSTIKFAPMPSISLNELFDLVRKWSYVMRPLAQKGGGVLWDDRPVFQTLVPVPGPGGTTRRWSATTLAGWDIPGWLPNYGPDPRLNHLGLSCMWIKTVTSTMVVLPHHRWEIIRGPVANPYGPVHCRFHELILLVSSEIISSPSSTRQRNRKYHHAKRRNLNSSHSSSIRALDIPPKVTSSPTKTSAETVVDHSPEECDASHISIADDNQDFLGGLKW